MPIIWKTSFEEPLLKQLQSGQISNSKKLVDTIGLLYDLSIKQGLPAAPAVGGGPFVTGNLIAFKKILSIYFKIETAKQQALVVKSYAITIKGILQTIKQTTSEISKKRIELRTVLQQQRKIVNETKRLRNSNTIESKQRLIELQLKSRRLELVKNSITVELDIKKQYIINTVKPRIQQIKKQLQDLIIRFAFPMLQPTILSVIKSIPKLLKQVATDLKNKKKQYLDTIKSNVSKINQINREFKKLRGALSKEDASRIRNSINKLIKGTSIDTLTVAGNLVTSTISKYPESKIDAKLKNVCISNVNKIIKLKIDILNTKQIAKNFFREKIKERKDDIVGSLKPKAGPGPSKIQEARQRIKELKSIITEYKEIVNRASKAKQTVTKIKAEYVKIKNASDSNVYIPNTNLAAILNSQTPGTGDKYLQINNIRSAKSFLFTAITSASGTALQLNQLKDKYKSNVKEIQQKIISQRVNPKEIVFNSFLRSAVLAYWTGGVMSNPALPTTVLNPGLVTLPVSLKPTANPANFVRSLSKTLQLHTSTVSGLHVIPGTPPVTLPWVGYK